MKKKIIGIRLSFVIVLLFHASSGFAQDHYTRAAETGRIGLPCNNPKPETCPATKECTVYLPLNAEIAKINVFMKNCFKEDGCSYYEPTNFTSAPLIGYNGQGYSEWGGGWANVTLVENSTTPNNIVVRVKFANWKDDNPRYGKLSVEYFYPDKK